MKRQRTLTCDNNHNEHNIKKHKNAKICSYFKYNIPWYLIHSDFLDFAQLCIAFTTCKHAGTYANIYAKRNSISFTETRKDLDFKCCITNATLMHWLNLSFATLTKLDITNCKQITDEGLKCLQSREFKLRDLNISGCELITDQGLKYLEHLPLTHLDISFCELITNQGLIVLEKLPLTCLNLVRCVLITSKGLTHLKNLPLINLSIEWITGMKYFKKQLSHKTCFTSRDTELKKLSLDLLYDSQFLNGVRPIPQDASEKILIDDEFLELISLFPLCGMPFNFKWRNWHNILCIIDHPIDHPIDHTIDQLIDHPIDQLIDNTIDHPIDHPIDQFVDHGNGNDFDNHMHCFRNCHAMFYEVMIGVMKKGYWP